MRKRTRIIQISGFKGLLTAVFMLTCLAAGFIAFPAIVAMNLWNYAANYVAIPAINIYQGLMLWAITAITGFIINDRKKYLVAFSPKQKLSEAQIKRILDSVQAHKRAMDSIVSAENIKKDCITKDEKEKENV